MDAIRPKTVSVGDGRGFTLPEVLVTIAIMGILLAIAVAIWLGLIEQRRVDAAANQLASDLRLAHSSATNQLTDWRVVLDLNGDRRSYRLERLERPYLSGTVPPTVRTIQRTLPEGTKVASTTANPASTTPFIELNSDGTLYVVSGPNGHVMVSSTDGDPRRKVGYRSATSRVKVE